MNNSTVWDSIQFGQCVQKKRQKMMFTHEDDPRMWNFLAENFQNYGPFEVFTKMKEALGYEHADKSLYYRFRNILAPNLHLTHFSVETKLQIAKKFNLLLNEEFKQNLLHSMNLVFDPNGCIEDFSWKSNVSIGSTPSTSTEMLLSFAAPVDRKQKRGSTSSELSQNGNKKPRRNATEINESIGGMNSETSPLFLETLREMISETVMASNRKLIEELKASKIELKKETESNVSTPKNGSLKHYLNGLKGLLDHMNSPELSNIRERIKSIEEKFKDDDAPLSINCVYSMLDAGLKMIGG